MPSSRSVLTSVIRVTKAVASNSASHPRRRWRRVSYPVSLMPTLPYSDLRIVSGVTRLPFSRCPDNGSFVARITRQCVYGSNQELMTRVTALRAQWLAGLLLRYSVNALAGLQQVSHVEDDGQVDDQNGDVEETLAMNQPVDFVRQIDGT